MTQIVANVRAERNEAIQAAIDSIGKSNARQQIFEAVYKGKKRLKTITEIAKATGLSEKHVLTEGKKLVNDDIIHAEKTASKKTAYKKISVYSTHKKKVLAGLKNPRKAAAKYPTKQRPEVGGVTIQKIAIAKSYVPMLVHVDDIDSFCAVRGVDDRLATDFTKMAEQTIKNGFQRILKQEGTFKDWGGEINDLYTGKLRYKGRRIAAAFAFKGKATKDSLTPNKMGKHGDQIGRLFNSPAQMFFVVYPRTIKESIVDQMRAYAIARAKGGEKIYYCAIGGSDFTRLFHAYPAAFKVRKKKGR